MRRQIEGSRESTKADIPYFPCTSLFPSCEHKRLLAFVTTREDYSKRDKKRYRNNVFKNRSKNRRKTTESLKHRAISMIAHRRPTPNQKGNIKKNENKRFEKQRTS